MRLTIIERRLKTSISKTFSPINEVECTVQVIMIYDDFIIYMLDSVSKNYDINKKNDINAK